MKWALIILLLFSSLAGAATVYVSADSGDDLNSGLSWPEAKQTLQAGIDAASAGDTVLVTNGVYEIGGVAVYGSMVNRVAVTNMVHLSSVNGPEMTLIRGEGLVGPGAVRCAYVGGNSYLSGFTLTNGATLNSGEFIKEVSGGGLWCEQTAIVSNCIITGNTSGYTGGGSYGGTLNNCILMNNSSDVGGGGAFAGQLNNCTLMDNSSLEGGGSCVGTLNNCTIMNNSASWQGGGSSRNTLNNCVVVRNSATDSAGGAYNSTVVNCTLVNNTAPIGGGARGGELRNTIVYGNSSTFTNALVVYCYTNDPFFADFANDDFRLMTNSPCINAGLNAYTPTNATPFDLAGNPRINDGIVDIGAFEYYPLAFIYALSGANGKISPSGFSAVFWANSKYFQMIPDLYFDVEDVLTNNASIGADDFYTWENVTGVNTIMVYFTEILTSNGTPHVWLAGYGWTQDFETVDNLDFDNDGLLTWQEYAAGINPTNSNTDGDQFNDGVEFFSGADPRVDNSDCYLPILNNPDRFGLYTSNAIINNPEQFGLYSSNSIGELAYGNALLTVSNQTLKISINMKSTDDLSGTWTNIGPELFWEVPVTNKAFYRFSGS